MGNGGLHSSPSIDSSISRQWGWLPSQQLPDLASMVAELVTEPLRVLDIENILHSENWVQIEDINKGTFSELFTLGIMLTLQALNFFSMRSSFFLSLSISIFQNCTKYIWSSFYKIDLKLSIDLFIIWMNSWLSDEGLSLSASKCRITLTNSGTTDYLGTNPDKNSFLLY